MNLYKIYEDYIATPLTRLWRYVRSYDTEGVICIIWMSVSGHPRYFSYETEKWPRPTIPETYLQFS